MGAAGRQRALAEFTWSAVATKTMEVYAEVLASATSVYSGCSPAMIDDARRRTPTRRRGR